MVLIAKMSLMEVGEVAFGPLDDLIHWMQSKHFLASCRDCSSCNTAMVVSSRNDVSDGYRYKNIFFKTM